MNTATRCLLIFVCIGSFADPWGGRVFAERVPAPSVLYGTSGIITDGVAAMVDLKVEVSAIGTYWCTLLWNCGYLGVQLGGSSGYSKHMHFSVWDLDGGGMSQLIYKDDRTIGTRFGGEGTGVVTYYPCNWLEGYTYTFTIILEPYSDGSEYRGYFFDPVIGTWTLLATIQRPHSWPTLGYVGGFLEDFAGTSGVQRSGLHGNCWIQGTNGVWRWAQDVYFNASVPQSNQPNYDGAVVGSMFRLQTGGSTINHLAILNWYQLDVGSMNITPPTPERPQLGIFPSAGELKIDWLAKETGWRLESTAWLADRVVGKETPTPPALTNGQYEVHVPRSNLASFFRLRKP